MPNWVTIKPASDNFDPSKSDVGGNWVTIKPGNTTSDIPVPEPSAFEKIGAFASGLWNFAKEVPGAVITPIVKTGLSIGELANPYNIASLTTTGKESLSGASVNVFGNKVTSIQQSAADRSAAYKKGEISKEQLLGGAAMDSIDVATSLIAPIEGLLKNTGKLVVKQAMKVYGPDTFGAIFSEGSRIIGKDGIDEMLKKGGGKFSAEATDSIIKAGADSLGKNGILKGNKLVSKAGFTALATNPLVAGGTAYGAGYGLAGGMQQNQGALDLAKSTAEGTLYGIGGGVALHTVGKLIGGATSKLTSTIANKNAGPEAVAEARTTIKAAEELLGHKLGNTEAKQITKSVFDGSTKEQVINSIIKEADNAKVDLNTSNIVAATGVHPSPDATISGIFDAPETAQVSSEIVAAKSPSEVKTLLPDFIPEAEKAAVAKRLSAVKSPEEVANVLDGYNPAAITDKVATQVSKTENTASIEKMIAGIVPEKDIKSVAKDLSSMKDPAEIANVLDSYKTPKEVLIAQEPVKPTAETPTQQTQVVEPKTKTQTYTGTGETKQRQSAVTFNENLIRNGQEAMKDIPEYNVLKDSEQIAAAKKLFSEDPEKLFRIAANEEHSNDMTSWAAVNIINASGDRELINRLANNISFIEKFSQMTTAGQDASSMRLLTEDNPLRVMNEIRQSRAKGLAPDKMVELNKKTDKEIKMTKAKMSIQKAQDVLDKLLCQ